MTLCQDIFRPVSASPPGNDFAAQQAGQFRAVVPWAIQKEDERVVAAPSKCVAVSWTLLNGRFDLPRASSTQTLKIWH